jgi:hypothetical protein
MSNKSDSALGIAIAGLALSCVVTAAFGWVYFQQENNGRSSQLRSWSLPIVVTGMMVIVAFVLSIINFVTSSDTLKDTHLSLPVNGTIAKGDLIVPRVIDGELKWSHAAPQSALATSLGVEVHLLDSTVLHNGRVHVALYGSNPSPSTDSSALQLLLRVSKLSEDGLVFGAPNDYSLTSVTAGVVDVIVDSHRASLVGLADGSGVLLVANDNLGPDSTAALVTIDVDPTVAPTLRAPLGVIRAINNVFAWHFSVDVLSDTLAVMSYNPESNSLNTPIIHLQGMVIGSNSLTVGSKPVPVDGLDGNYTSKVGRVNTGSGIVSLDNRFRAFTVSVTGAVTMTGPQAVMIPDRRKAADMNRPLVVSDDGTVLLTYIGDSGALWSILVDVTDLGGAVARTSDLVAVCGGGAPAWALSMHMRSFCHVTSTKMVHLFADSVDTDTRATSLVGHLSSPSDTTFTWNWSDVLTDLGPSDSDWSVAAVGDDWRYAVFSNNTDSLPGASLVSVDFSAAAGFVTIAQNDNEKQEIPGGSSRLLGVSAWPQKGPLTVSGSNGMVQMAINENDVMLYHA